jgi:heptosyltransferase I
MRNKNRHAVDEVLDVVGHLDLKRLKPEFPVRFPPMTVTDKRPRVAMVPVSRWATKNWPAECYVEVIRFLRRYREASFFLLGGPADREICDRIESEAGGGVVNKAGELSLVETGSLLGSMDILISNDSGPVHMAVAVGIPTLVIFGPTDPLRTGPYGDKQRVVTANLDCQPCFSRTCRRAGIPCLSGVTPERVGEVALEILK